MRMRMFRLGRFSCFHSINIPSEWGLALNLWPLALNLKMVSIQLISPASGDMNPIALCVSEGLSVSIQLISPASGDLWWFSFWLDRRYSRGFHSINIPSEWGSQNIEAEEAILGGICFHSINIPSEWGFVDVVFPKGLIEELDVSIQLISPASGDSSEILNKIQNLSKQFPFN